MPRKSTHDFLNELTFAKVYPLYLNKVEKKGKTKAELHQVITWLTGYDDAGIDQLVTSGATFGDMFAKAQMHPNTHLIKGVVCGHRVEEIEDKFVQQVRYLDKLIDELTRGKKMQSILRTEK